MNQPQNVVFFLGSLNMDLVCYADDFPKGGQTIMGNSFSTACGGKGSNQAFMAAQLAPRNSIKFLGCIGKDDFGKTCVKNLEENGVDISLIQKCETNTGIALITVTPETNTIIVVSGANSECSPKLIEKFIPEIKKSSVLVCQFEIPMETNLTALKIAKEENVLTIVNPAPFPKTFPLLNEILNFTDIICPNETEAESLSGIPVTDINSAKKACKKILNLTKNNSLIIVITLGKNGCVIYDKNNKEKEFIHIETKKVNAIDTTGAGDCFVGSFSWFLSQTKLEKSNLEKIVKKSMKLASFSVTRKGAQSSYPTQREIENVLKE